MPRSTDDACTSGDVPMPRSNPRYPTPNDDQRLRPLHRPECSLAEDLGGVADDLRQMYTQFGLRPYRLFSVVTCWSGGVRGRGVQQVVSETELLPTPLVKLNRLKGEATAAGRAERGMMKISEISPRYTEDDIFNLFFVQPLQEGQEGFLEMRMDCRDGNSRRRRFVVSGVPERLADRFEWVVMATEQEQARNRAGQLPGAG